MINEIDEESAVRPPLEWRNQIVGRSDIFDGNETFSRRRRLV
jgi:hypothetical protein